MARGRHNQGRNPSPQHQRQQEQQPAQPQQNGKKKCTQHTWKDFPREFGNPDFNWCMRAWTHQDPSGKTPAKIYFRDPRALRKESPEELDVDQLYEWKRYMQKEDPAQMHSPSGARYPGKQQPEPPKKRSNETSKPANRQAAWDNLLVLYPEIAQQYGEIPQDLLDEYRLDVFGNVVALQALPHTIACFELDHAFPWSRGGYSVMSNLTAMSEPANRGKSDTLHLFIVRHIEWPPPDDPAAADAKYDPVVYKTHHPRVIADYYFRDSTRTLVRFPTGLRPSQFRELVASLKHMEGQVGPNSPPPPPPLPQQQAVPTTPATNRRQPRHLPQSPEQQPATPVAAASAPAAAASPQTPSTPPAHTGTSSWTREVLRILLCTPWTLLKDQRKKITSITALTGSGNIHSTLKLAQEFAAAMQRTAGAMPYIQQMLADVEASAGGNGSEPADADEADENDADDGEEAGEGEDEDEHEEEEEEEEGAEPAGDAAATVALDGGQSSQLDVLAAIQEQRLAWVQQLQQLVQQNPQAGPEGAKLVTAAFELLDDQLRKLLEKPPGAAGSPAPPLPQPRPPRLPPMDRSSQGGVLSPVAPAGPPPVYQRPLAQPPLPGAVGEPLAADGPQKGSDAAGVNPGGAAAQGLHVAPPEAGSQLLRDAASASPASSPGAGRWLGGRETEGGAPSPVRASAGLQAAPATPAAASAAAAAPAQTAPAAGSSTGVVGPPPSGPVPAWQAGPSAFLPAPAERSRGGWLRRLIPCLNPEPSSRHARNAVVPL